MAWQSAWILDFGLTEIRNCGGVGLNQWVVWVMGLDRWIDVSWVKWWRGGMGLDR